MNNPTPFTKQLENIEHKVRITKTLTIQFANKTNCMSPRQFGPYVLLQYWKPVDYSQWKQSLNNNHNISIYCISGRAKQIARWNKLESDSFWNKKQYKKRNKRELHPTLLDKFINWIKNG